MGVSRLVVLLPHRNPQAGPANIYRKANRGGGGGGGWGGAKVLSISRCEAWADKFTPQQKCRERFRHDRMSIREMSVWMIR